jgi:hypothetical protein
MFAQRIRNITLALAGAALATTTVMAPVAAAAPQLPGKLPTADVRVTKNYRSSDENHNVIFYYFKVKNAGPDAVKVRVEESCYVVDAHDVGSVVKQEVVMDLDKNEERGAIVDCHWPAGGYVIHGAVSAKLIDGIDPNTSNNHDYFAE